MHGLTSVARRACLIRVFPHATEIEPHCTNITILMHQGLIHQSIAKCPNSDETIQAAYSGEAHSEQF